MIYALVGILIGIIIGLNFTYTIPVELIKYTAVIIIGILDSLFGAIKAELREKKYNPTIFTTGLIFNIIMALGITLLGENLGLDLYLAVTFVFTYRIFTNLAKIRREIIEKLQHRRRW